MNLVKLKPATKDYIWAGTKLKKCGKEAPYDNIAECWELSFHKDGPSVIDSGEDKGRLLKDVATKEDLGEYAASFPFFPVLIKLIDSGDRSESACKMLEELYGKRLSRLIIIQMMNMP